MRVSASILVVDDDEVHLAISAFVLSQAGHTVHTAASGVEAVRVAAVHPLDLVLLDLNMPGLSGWDTLRGLRRLEPAKRVPVLAFTAADDEVPERLRRAGFSGYARKAASHQQLPRVVELAMLTDSVGASWSECSACLTEEVHRGPFLHRERFEVVPGWQGHATCATCGSTVHPPERGEPGVV